MEIKMNREPYATEADIANAKRSVCLTEDNRLVVYLTIKVGSNEVIVAKSDRDYPESIDMIRSLESGSIIV